MSVVTEWCSYFPVEYRLSVNAWLTFDRVILGTKKRIVMWCNVVSSFLWGTSVKGNLCNLCFFVFFYCFSFVACKTLLISLFRSAVLPSTLLWAWLLCRLYWRGKKACWTGVGLQVSYAPHEHEQFESFHFATQNVTGVYYILKHFTFLWTVYYFKYSSGIQI